MSSTQSLLVTGAAGFIGSRVCELLLRRGWAVVAVDNLNDAYDVRLKQWRLAALAGKPGFEFHQLDIADATALGPLWRRGNGRPFDAVINLAARAGVRQSVENPWVYFESNVTGTLNLLQLCRDHDVEKFVLASTSGLYGDRNPQPFREDYNTDGPLSPYAASKKSAEVLGHTYHYLYGLDVTVLRYFTVYGPAGRPDMSVFRFAQAIAEGRPLTVYGDGQQSRDFTYVEDIACGTLAALRPVGYEVINLGGDRPTVLMEAIHLLEEMIGRKACVEFTSRHRSDVPATWADIRKAGRLLGWRPQWSFEAGLAQLVDWYRSNREWARGINTS